MHNATGMADGVFEIRASYPGAESNYRRPAICDEMRARYNTSSTSEPGMLFSGPLHQIGSKGLSASATEWPVVPQSDANLLKHASW